MPRQARIVIPDTAHYVIQRGNYRQKIEDDPEMAEDIRLKTDRGLVVGTEKFMKKLENRLNRSLRCLNQGRPRKGC